MKNSKVMLAASLAAALVPGLPTQAISGPGEDLRHMIAPSWRPYVGPTFRHRTKNGPGRSKGSTHSKRNLDNRHVTMYRGFGQYEVRNLRKLLGTRK